MTETKYEYKIKTPFGEATYYHQQDVLDFVKLCIRQFREITIIRQEQK